MTQDKIKIRKVLLNLVAYVLTINKEYIITGKKPIKYLDIQEINQFVKILYEKDLL